MGYQRDSRYPAQCRGVLTAARHRDGVWDAMIEKRSPMTTQPPSPPQLPPQIVVTAAPPAPPRGLSITSMVLALVSIVFGFTFLLPLLSLILGFVGLKKEPAGRGMAITGIVISGLILLVWVAVVAVIVVIGLAAAASAGASQPL